MQLANKMRNERFSASGMTIIPSQNKIVTGGQELVVQPKVMFLLQLLCEARGETVSKEILIEKIWPSVVVSHESLTNLITRLRRVLKDDAKTPVYIETVQGKGYRWVHKVEWPESDTQNQVKSYHRLWPVAFVSLLLVSGVWWLKGTAQNESKISDLNIKQVEGAVEIAVGFEMDPTQEGQQNMLKQVETLTGIDVSKGKVEIKIDEAPTKDN